MANRPANIHDAFFKKVLADPETAGTFLREYLPPDVAACATEDENIGGAAQTSDLCDYLRGK